VSHPVDNENPREAATTWGAGDYELMAERLQPASVELVDLAAITADDAVLDLACGTGNAALIAAGYADRVVGVDFEPRLLEIAGARASSAGLAVDWVCGDVLSHGLPEHEFSVVLSAFGVMYAPDQSAAAAALARASASGARVVLASWTPGSFMPAMGGVFGSYLPPPPPGGVPPSRWGDEGVVTELLSSHDIDVRFTRRSSLRLSFADCTEARRFLIRTAGDLLRRRPSLEREGRWTDLEHDLDDLIRDRNRATGHAVELECEYLLVLAEAAGR
jgi:SAM-dependent methyltransferase